MYKEKVFIITQNEIVNTTGGAITSFTDISKFLCEKYDVYAICYTKETRNPNLDERIKFINLYNYYGGRNTFSKAINLFIKENRPSIILFFFAYLYVNAKLSKKYNDIPRILLFRSRPDFYFAVHKKTKHLKDIYINTISQILFPSYHKLLPEYIRNKNVVCIPNPTKSVLKYINTDAENKKIIYLSRIDCWKGHEFLIKSFALIANKYKDWTIDIYGQSQPPELELQLKKLVKSLHLENQIHFCGVTKNPFETFINYDFCVFPSYFEGFPNGLSEALSVGLPAVGFKGASGVNELIIDNKNGLLAEEDYSDFAEKIEILINDKKLRSKFSQEAVKSMKKYDYNIIKDTWINLINETLSNKCTEQSKELYSVSEKYELFSINKLLSMQNSNMKFSYRNFAEKIFSIKNYYSNSCKKILTILGMKITIKKQLKENGSGY